MRCLVRSSDCGSSAARSASGRPNGVPPVQRGYRGAASGRVRTHTAGRTARLTSCVSMLGRARRRTGLMSSPRAGLRHRSESSFRTRTASCTIRSQPSMAVVVVARGGMDGTGSVDLRSCLLRPQRESEGATLLSTQSATHPSVKGYRAVDESRPGAAKRCAYCPNILARLPIPPICSIIRCIAAGSPNDGREGCRWDMA